MAKIFIFRGETPLTRSILGNRVENIVNTSAWICPAFNLSPIGTPFWKYSTQVKTPYCAEKYKHIQRPIHTLHIDFSTNFRGFAFSLHFLWTYIGCEKNHIFATKICNEKWFENPKTHAKKTQKCVMGLSVWKHDFLDFEHQSVSGFWIFCICLDCLICKT